MKKNIQDYSIARRLAIMYAIVAAVVLSIVVVGLYCIEISEIIRYQKSELKNRVALLEHNAFERTNYKKWLHFKETLSEVTPQGSNTYIRVDSENPAYSFETPYAVKGVVIKKFHGFSKIMINEREYRSISKIIPPNGERPQVILTLAVDTYLNETEDYLLDLAFMLILFSGASIIAYLGWRIAKHSLAPVDMLSKAAADLDPQNPSDRLPNTNLPIELSGLVHSFNGALERLEESYNKLSTFNSDVAHELRTPLGNLIGETEVALSRPRSKEELEEVMLSNLEELERLRTIINEMLFLSRADHGELATNLKLSSLAQIIEETAEFLEVIFEENDTKLEVIGDVEVMVEQSLLKRAITNLLSNAVQHGATKTNIKVVIEKTSDHAILSVINKGGPISEPDLKNIFTRFYRISKDRHTKKGNFGLGLAIVNAVATMHGGEVFAENYDGLVKIGFTIPLKKANNDETK